MGVGGIGGAAGKLAPLAPRDVNTRRLRSLTKLTQRRPRGAIALGAWMRKGQQRGWDSHGNKHLFVNLMQLFQSNVVTKQGSGA